jgi:hypothetical protein
MAIFNRDKCRSAVGLPASVEISCGPIKLTALFGGKKKHHPPTPFAGLVLYNAAKS